MKQLCIDCRFYEGRRDFQGICRRRAPSMLVSGGVDYPKWPRVIGGADWCGDFEPQPAKGGSDRE